MKSKIQGANENASLSVDTLLSAYGDQCKKDIQTLIRQSISARSPREYENGDQSFVSTTNRILTNRILDISGLNIREVCNEVFREENAVKKALVFHPNPVLVASKFVDYGDEYLQIYGIDTMHDLISQLIFELRSVNPYAIVIITGLDLLLSPFYNLGCLDTQGKGLLQILRSRLHQISQLHSCPCLLSQQLDLSTGTIIDFNDIRFN